MLREPTIRLLLWPEPEGIVPGFSEYKLPNPVECSGQGSGEVGLGLVSGELIPWVLPSG